MFYISIIHRRPHLSTLCTVFLKLCFIFCDFYQCFSTIPPAILPAFPDAPPSLLCRPRRKGFFSMGKNDALRRRSSDLCFYLHDRLLSVFCTGMDIAAGSFQKKTDCRIRVARRYTPDSSTASRCSPEIRANCFCSYEEPSHSSSSCPHAR